MTKRTANFYIELDIEIPFHPAGEYFAFDFDLEFDDDEVCWDDTELEQAAYSTVRDSISIIPTFSGWRSNA